MGSANPRILLSARATDGNMQLDYRSFTTAH